MIELNKIYNLDCVDLMKLMEKESVDLICADPPYGISSKSLLAPSKYSGYKSEKGDWDYIDNYEEFSIGWTNAVDRVAKNNATIYVFGAFTSLIPVYNNLNSLGWKFHCGIVWTKPNPAPSVHRRTYTNACELILCMSKGKNWKYNYYVAKQFNFGKQLTNVWRAASVRKVAGCVVKPTKLLETMIAVSSDIGDVVFDPFIGTGTTAVVAKSLGRKFIGSEKDSDRCLFAVNRLEEVI